MDIIWKCSDCRDEFTAEAAVEHAKPEVCPEWGNHMMYEATFTPRVSDIEVCEQHVPMFDSTQQNATVNFCRTCGVWYKVNPK